MSPRAAQKAKAKLKPTPRPKSKSKLLVAAPEVATSEKFSGWKLAIALGLALGLLWPILEVVQIKVSQHVTVRKAVPILEQGDVPGRLSGVVGLKGLPGGSVISLSRFSGGWRLQRFNASLALERHFDLPTEGIGELSDLAPLPGGGVMLAAQDGRTWVLGPDLKVKGKGTPSGLAEIRALVAHTDGSVMALDATGAQVAKLDAKGLAAPPQALKSARGIRAMVALPEGRSALLEDRGRMLWVRVLDRDLKTQVRFKVPEVALSSPVRLAASGEVLAINDAAGTRGVVYYHSSGRPMGYTMGEGNTPITHPGFVAGDPDGFFVYIHYGVGLMKAVLPWAEKETP